MKLVLEFIVHNFVLLCLSLVMIFNAILSYSHNKRLSRCILIITGCCFLLALSYTLQEQFKPLGYRYPVILLSIFGYTIRPLCLYVFILMNRRCYRGKYSFIVWIPLAINLIIYLLALIPYLGQYIFTFNKNDDGTLSFMGGPLRFTSHIISFGYLVYLLYISIFTLKAKHIIHGITLIVCAFFVTAAVLIETFLSDDGEIEILNATIMVSTLTYYLYLYKESVQIDSATGLFNRETLYHDLPRMTKTVTGVINFDINGLKYINDNFGHFEGDKAIFTIAETINACLKKNMYAYRVGGDEFVVIANGTTEKMIEESAQKFKDILSKTTYYCSVGCAFKNDRDIDIEELIKEAEKNMYVEKKEFYKHAPFERRKSI